MMFRLWTLVFRLHYQAPLLLLLSCRHFAVFLLLNSKHSLEIQFAQIKHQDRHYEMNEHARKLVVGHQNVYLVYLLQFIKKFKIDLRICLRLIAKFYQKHIHQSYHKPGILDFEAYYAR